MPRTVQLLGVALVSACASGRPVARIGGAVREATGHALLPDRTPDEHRATLPDGVRIDDGLSEEEAVAIALWNSPRLRADLTRVAVAEGDLAGARRPSNPTLRLLFPAGPQQLGILITWPLENLVFMRRRIAVARINLHVAAKTAVQAALDLVREARLAHVDWRFAAERLAVRRIVAAQAAEIAEIAEARGAAGDIPLREGDAARADARVAEDEAVRSEADVAIAEARLRTTMGWTEGARPLVPAQGDSTLDAALPDTDLAAEGVASRPDLRAAELAIEAARARLRLERVGALRFAGVASGEGRSFTGGAQAEIPIFDQNQAGIARARADLEAAQWSYQDLHLRVVTDVAQARLQYERALASLNEYRDTIVVARVRDMDVVTATYDEGEIDYSGVLLAAQRLEAARLREVELTAELRRARAELERALGRRLDAVRKEAPC